MSSAKANVAASTRILSVRLCPCQCLQPPIYAPPCSLLDLPIGVSHIRPKIRLVSPWCGALQCSAASLRTLPSAHSHRHDCPSVLAASGTILNAKSLETPPRPAFNFKCSPPRAPLTSAFESKQPLRLSVAWHAAARMHAAIRLAETRFRVTVPGPLKLAHPRRACQCAGPGALRVGQRRRRRVTDSASLASSSWSSQLELQA